MNPRSVLIVAALIVSAACGSPDRRVAAAEATADLIIVNGKVHTVDDANRVVQAVAIGGNTIIKVGTNDDIRSLSGPATRVIDARGATVAPGFNDSHVHFLSGGRSLSDVDLAGLTTLRQVQDKIRVFAADKPADAWIKGRGWLYSPFPNASPTRAQLDEVVPDRPAVMTCYDGHSVWVNSRVLALAGITKATKDPVNGVIVRDANGEPTGHLKESATDLISHLLPKPTEEDRRAALEAAVAHANRIGITSIQNAGGAVEEIGLYDAVKKGGGLTVRSYLATSARSGISESDADRMDALWKQYGDDPTLHTGIVKLYADGVIESKTAAMLSPYVGTPSAGTPNYSVDELNRIVAMFDKRGWQIQIHAIGDRAIRMSLDALEKAAAANPAPARGRRHRIEHVETIDPADIPRFAKLGVIASMQPIHAELGDMNSLHPSGPWPDNLGAERASRAWQWKSIRDAGGRITFGSDWGVATLDPLQGIWLAATRLAPAGMRDQHLSMAEAVNGYTSWAAYASFEDQRKGTLAAGMLADLVVLSRDLLASPPARPPDVVVDTTIFDGKMVYRRAR